MAALWLLLILAAKVYDADADADDTFLCLFVDLMVVVVVQMTWYLWKTYPWDNYKPFHQAEALRHSAGLRLEGEVGIIFLDQSGF